MHACPGCGEETNGAWSEGGTKWALCESCLARERELADPIEVPSHFIEPSICASCWGAGEVINCCDDLCHGTGHFIHGDNEVCPECGGEGEVYD